MCQRTKITRAPCRRRSGGAVPRAENFGDLTTADHKVLSEGCVFRNNNRYAVVVQDLATQWIQPYPCKTKTSQETQRSLQKLLEPERKPKVIYTDNSLEFGKACEDLSWNHCTSTPHRSETIGIAERAVRRVKEGTSAVLLQSGLNESWSADSMECYTNLRNIQDLLSDGKTPYERRWEIIHCNIIIWYTNLFLCLKPWRYPQPKQQWTRNGKNWRNFRRGTWRKSEVNQLWSMKQGRRAQKFILPHWWTSVIWRQSTKSTKVELYSEATLWKMILDLMQYPLNRDHPQLKWQPQKSWMLNQDCQGAQDKQLTQYLLILR